MYKQLKDQLSNLRTDCILRLADMATIPFDLANTDYQAYLKWVSEGNTPEQAD